MSTPPTPWTMTGSPHTETTSPHSHTTGLAGSAAGGRGSITPAVQRPIPHVPSPVPPTPQPPPPLPLQHGAPLPPTTGASPPTVAARPGRQRKRPSSTPVTGDSSRKPRRDRGPNWNVLEMLALIDAKREEFLEELDTVDSRDLMDPNVTKWTRISCRVMVAGFSPCLRDHAMCKSKWHLLIPDYRRIADYHARTGTNTQLYWSQSTREHVQEGLPKTFAKELYYRIDDWYGRRPQIQPPHVRDLMNPRDRNYEAEREESNDDVEEVDENLGEDSIDPMDILDPPSPVHAARLPMPAGCGRGMSPSPASTSPLPPTCTTSPRHGMPPPAQRMSPILLSSSESGGSNSRRGDGSTGVRRRTSAAQTALADATKATGEVMVTQMKEMVGATRETESNRLEVQLRLFSENMHYQRKKDRRLYEQGLAAAENARLAIVKQGELVQCLAGISKVLSEDLMVADAHENHGGGGYRSPGAGSQTCPGAAVHAGPTVPPLQESAPPPARH